MGGSKSVSRSRKLRSHGRVASCISWVAGVVALLVLVVIGIVVWSFYFSPQTDVIAGESVEARIGQGSTTREIASQLVALGVVENANRFVLASRLARADGRLQPGGYEFVTGMSDRDVIDALVAGPRTEGVSVTIPEGYRIEQIADRLQEAAGIPKSEFVALAKRGAPRFAARHPYLARAYGGSLEGYLFPKTYQVRKDMSAEQVIEMMLAQFERETSTLDYSAAQKRGLSPREVLVIASMIERESKLDAERPLVSSVIYNRLRRRMRLKIDATIEYVLRSNRFRLTNADLYTKSPYNTYLHEGLPPGPISNPGIKSLQAAAAPADTAFIYYVLTGKDGSHTFTTNLADFLSAKRRSKEVFGR